MPKYTAGIFRFNGEYFAMHGLAFREMKRARRTLICQASIWAPRKQYQPSTQELLHLEVALRQAAYRSEVFAPGDLPRRRLVGRGGRVWSMD